MLSPQDLINLSRADENFCRTLTANNVSFVWKAVREADGGIEPPQGIPEYRWVDLLFGQSVCDVGRNLVYMYPSNPVVSVLPSQECLC